MPACVCVHACSPTYLACEAHVPYYNLICGLIYHQRMRAIFYCHFWPLWLHHIFTHYLINGTISDGEKIVEHKICFDFLYNVYLKHFSF